MKYCMNCDKQQMDDAVHCPECGNLLVEVVDEEEQAQEDAFEQDVAEEVLEDETEAADAEEAAGEIEAPDDSQGGDSGEEGAPAAVEPAPKKKKLAIAVVVAAVVVAVAVAAAILIPQLMGPKLSNDEVVAQAEPVLSGEIPEIDDKWVDADGLALVSTEVAEPAGGDEGGTLHALVTATYENSSIRVADRYNFSFARADDEWQLESHELDSRQITPLAGVSNEKVAGNIVDLLAKAEETSPGIQKAYSGGQFEVRANSCNEEGGAVVVGISSEQGICTYKGQLEADFAWDTDHWTVKSCKADDAALNPEYKSVVGVYGVNLGGYDASAPMGGFDASYVVEVTDQQGADITFNIAFVASNARYVYNTEDILASLDGNTANFKYTDSFLNEGHGTLEFAQDSVTITAVEDVTSEWNRSTLARDHMVLPKTTYDDLDIDHSKSGGGQPRAPAEEPVSSSGSTWYLTLLAPESSDYMPTVTSARIEGDTLYLTGSMYVSSSDLTDYSSCPVEGPREWSFAIAPDAVLQASGGYDPSTGLPGRSLIDRETFAKIFADLPGLGLELHVENGVVVFMDSSS